MNYKFLTLLATSSALFYACSDFSADFKGDATLDYGKDANSILTCSASLDGKVVKPADESEYRLCKDGQWFAVEIGDFNEEDIIKPTAKSSSSEASEPGPVNELDPIDEPESSSETAIAPSSSSKKVVITVDDPIVEELKTSSSSVKIAPSSSSVKVVSSSSSVKPVSSSAIASSSSKVIASSTSVVPSSSSVTVVPSSSSIKTVSSSSTVVKSSSSKADPVESLLLCEDGETIVVNLDNCPENQEESSSSITVAISSSEEVASSSSYVSAGLVPSGTYDCEEYNCVTTQYLNQDMLEAGDYMEYLDARDGQVYRAIQIGTQIWLAQNLNYETKEGNADDGISSWCYNDERDNCSNMGRMYTWTAAMDIDVAYINESASSVIKEKHQGLCPNGWHVPNDDEWNTLSSYTSEKFGETHIGEALKSASTWSSTGTLSNSTGFSGIAAGSRNLKGSYSDVGIGTDYWTASEYSDVYVNDKILYYSFSDLRSDLNNPYGSAPSANKGFAIHVRCLYDETAIESSSSEAAEITSSSSSEKIATPTQPYVSFKAANGVTYDCGPVSSCWVMSANKNSMMILDIANGTPKTADYYIENIETGWKQVNGSDLSDCPGWQDLPESGVYRLVINNWDEYTAVTDMDLQWSEGIYGSIYAIDFWKKMDWSNTLSYVDSLPTTIFNCENLEYPPTFTSTVTGELIPYIEAMQKTCPNIQGNASLEACSNAADYTKAKELYPSWFSYSESTSGPSLSNLISSRDWMWDGTNGDDQVNTGYKNGGIWFPYSDHYNSGESYFTWDLSNDWEDGVRSTANVASLTNKHNGLCGTVHLVNSKTTMYAGVGFDIVSGSKEGEDITDWNSITIVYSSEVNATLDLEANGRASNGYDDLRAELPATSEPKQITFTWSDFTQTGTRDKADLLTMIEMIDIQFNASGLQEGDFCLYAIGRN